MTGPEAEGVPEDAVVERRDEPLSATLDGEAVLLEPDSGTYYGMNDLGTDVWEHIESPTTVAEVEATIREAYDVDPGVVAQDVRSFLSDLADADLIEVHEPGD
jgi:hypothetical protein